MAAGEMRVAIDDPRYVKALAHPLRIRILAMLQERPASPVQLAPRLGSTLGRVAHHVRVLRDIGLIELVETRRRRGAIEHIYTVPSVPRFSDGAWEGLGAAPRRRVLAAALEQIGDYVAGSAAAGGFDRTDANLSRVPLRLDEQGWQELTAAGRRWLAETDGIQARAHERSKAGGDGTRDVGLVLLVFDALAFSDRPRTGGSSGRARPRGG
jgi:DNA-binding transcriptional ArsR family regulator